ncbi:MULTISPECIES: helix-turn-helix domain-containing protein [Nocardia]|uniref:helix-turn-helix domain-containing protein n=1 Tax=Nocardia TaxID=1817 RepID=UPI0024555161|nr:MULTISPECIES: helix-turn-helix transcriptional regulator [Nocardia]
MTADLGDRVASVRKRRGLTQRELSDMSGISLSLIKKIEQGERTDVRLETLRKLAVGLRVQTSVLQGERSDAEYADAGTGELWAEVRRALAGVYADVPDEQPTAAGVAAEIDRVRPLLGTHAYADAAAMLPALIRDADALDDVDGRAVRGRLLGMAGWLLVQNRQFDTAEMALTSAIDQLDDPVETASAANTLSWSMLRQGKLQSAQQIAVEWADRIEPRFSRATARELAAWGRMWLRVSNAAIRDNAPGAAFDALSLAEAAAARIGREGIADSQTVRAYGPVTVAHIVAETHVIADEPDRAIAVADRTPPPTFQPTNAGRLRHRLDIAHAHSKLGHWDQAMGELRTLSQTAPEWIAQQRYARDIVGGLVERRRTLTADMRELADVVRLEY